MLCDGKCETKKETEEGTVVKRCGLYAGLINEDKIRGKTTKYNACVFYAMMDGIHRLEQSDIRLQAAVESQRNEACNWSAEVAKTVATGMLGLINVVGGNGDKVVKAVKVLKNLESIKALEEKNKDVQRKGTEINSQER